MCVCLCLCPQMYMYMYITQFVLNYIYLVFKARSSSRDLHDVPNTLYDEMSLSKAHFSQATSSDTPAEHVYDVATSAAVGEGYPCKTPVPLHVNDAYGGNDK